MSHLQKRLGLFILGFLMVAFTIPPDFIIAQDDAQGWPVVQRCLTPTAAPEGWTYTGTILLDGYAGIHGVNADWATPRVLVFLNWPSKASARALSPDGNWLAVATQSHLEEAESDRWLTVFVDRIDIYSTLHFRETYSLPWSNQYTISTQRRSRTIRWWDNDTLIYESITQGRTGGGSFWPDSTFLIDPFTGDTSSWLSGLDPLDYLLYPSPDWERAVYNANEEPFEAWGLYSFEGELLTDLPWIRGDVQWNSDSSRFVTLIQQEDGERQIVLLNREGEITDTVFIPENYAPLYGWSWDNRYIAFTQEVRSADPYNVQHFLYLIDTQEKYIIDTCFDINRDAAWSPDGMQLALTGRGANYPIYIYDLELRGIYPVAEHSGDIIGWRAD